jgi:hypothetical protein
MSPRRLGDYDEGYFRNLTLGGIILRLVGLVVALTLVFGVVGLGLGWFKAGTDIISPANVKQQWQFAYDYSESLNAIGSQWCTAKKAEDGETNPDFKIQRSSQRIAVEQNYDRVKAVYDARLADAFRAKWVKPADVPDRAPTLQQTVAVLGCVS